ncbi:pyruvate kinase [Patescibacteria group bacterium]|nr:pyruvate kinase [Patescibacteria group bacterium]MBU1721885.1 pyruvate kinase [Patescibacteria group bacterium]MBU1900883.1 pyruvate kinase [Patescibacteria group bacterium]
MIKKRTKIVCTLGPACNTEEKIGQLIDAGMNVARLNFSHGTHENHANFIRIVRAVATEKQQVVGVLQDIQGPKIRLGILPEEGIMLAEDEAIIFDTGLEKYHEDIIPIGYDQLHTMVQAGERLLLSDGKVEVSITSIVGTRIYAVVVVAGKIFSYAGINVPDVVSHIPVLTDKDKEDVLFGIEQQVDMIAMSFVTRPQDILDLRYFIDAYVQEKNIVQEHPIKIIAKIERREAVEHMKEIIEVSDGIMVARGDLGIEIPVQQVPLVQKRLIDACLLQAKPVIVATQMLDSMYSNPRPTRAEVSDVANAVIDHTDAVMLSNETAMGAYPVKSVEMMHAIISEVEKSTYDSLPVYIQKNKHNVDDIISGLSRVLAEDVGAKAILAASLSGETGRLISRYRPELPVFVAAENKRVEAQLALSWGVQPFVLPRCHTIEELIERSLVHLKEKKLLKKGDRIIIVAGEPVGQKGHVNLLEVRDLD